MLKVEEGSGGVMTPVVAQDVGGEVVEAIFGRIRVALAKEVAVVAEGLEDVVEFCGE